MHGETVKNCYLLFGGFSFFHSLSNNQEKNMSGAFVDYQLNGKTFKGYLATPIDNPTKPKRAGILIAHTWRGLDDFIKDKAHELAKLGYVAMAADLFGDGKIAASDEEAASLILPLFTDRAVIQERIVAALNAFKDTQQVRHDAIGAIGFCFGGLCAIELLRSGAEIQGIVSFHGVLGDELAGHKAKRAKPSAMKGAALILHGNEDPLVSDQDISALKKEFTEAGIDWQFHIYGHTQHAFTNPNAHDAAKGLIYNEKAARRSWKAMKDFFEERMKI